MHVCLRWQVCGAAGWKGESDVSVRMLESISFACVPCGSLTNPFISEGACVGARVCVCVCLSGITHSFQTCLSSTLLCVQECVHVCTCECEIPLSVLKPSLAHCPLKEREREAAYTHITPVFVCECGVFQRCLFTSSGF